MLIKLILPYKTSKKTVQQSLSSAICMLGTVPILFFPSNQNNLEFTRNLFNSHYQKLIQGRLISYLPLKGLSPLQLFSNYSAQHVLQSSS